MKTVKTKQSYETFNNKVNVQLGPHFKEMYGKNILQISSIFVILKIHNFVTICPIQKIQKDLKSASSDLSDKQQLNIVKEIVHIG